MPKISVVIITYNEERNIDRCLTSVKDIADEIVIVDSYSTDRTEEISLKHGARFIKHEFEGHIEQKNYAITRAKYPRILSLDADEEISPRLKKSLLEVKENWKYDGYYFNRLTNYCGKWIKHTSWYPARKLRLWDSRKGKWGGINPHDKFILQKGCTQKHLKGDLLHYSYYTINEHLEQIKKFSDILAEAYYKKGMSASYFRVFFHPLWRFFRDYFLKTGFLSGLYGLIISVNSSHETFLKYVKLRKLIKHRLESPPHKICFFNTARSWGGGEKWHYDISTRLHKLGHQAIVYSNKHSELSKRLKDSGIPLYSIRISNLSFLSIYKIFRIAKVLRRERVKTIIINLSADFKVAGIAAKLAGVKEIIYRRGSAIPVRDSILNRFLYREVATTIIANSNETKRNIFINNSNLIPETKVKVLYNGLDLDLYGRETVEKLYTRKNGEVILGNAGRLSEEKGHVYLLQLANHLKEKNVPFKILIAGTGRLENKLKKMTEQMGLTDHVIFLGFVNNIQSFNESIDIYVLTSMWEGFGYVLVEAMAKGKPVVAFDIKSSSEIVEDQKTGFLVEKKNINQLSEKIEILIKDKELRNRFGIEGKKRVEQYFNMKTSLKQIEDIIDPDKPIPVRVN
jgi:glycosyltransferase involved in cell wall biosynthesis